MKNTVFAEWTSTWRYAKSAVLKEVMRPPVSAGCTQSQQMFARLSRSTNSSSTCLPLLVTHLVCGVSLHPPAGRRWVCTQQPCLQCLLGSGIWRTPSITLPTHLQEMFKNTGPPSFLDLTFNPNLFLLFCWTGWWSEQNRPDSDHQPVQQSRSRLKEEEISSPPSHRKSLTARSSSTAMW